MSNTVSDTKRIAFVVAPLTGDELQATRRDAAIVYSILTDPQLGMCHKSKSKLIHECSNRDNFQSELTSVLKDWDSQTQLIIYFSGHGEVANKNKYCLKIGETKYPFSNLISELEIAGVNRAIIILDTCHSGAAIGIKKDGSSLISEEVPQGIAIIASSKQTQLSYELQDGSADFSRDVEKEMRFAISQREPNTILCYI
ncbi:hypothetical protein RIVM261_075870 [Rivularia sp. IAM M-261]|nr:hypothetical protein RIVM261_075870 [Rivularia sp. IAM M-261]